MLVAVNVVVGVYQESRAKQTLDRLSVLTRPTATILRDGLERTADQREAVLGDALIVRLGDQLMLDGRVMSGAMEVDESLLTGEADRIPKRAGDEVLSGSVCVSGCATYLATRVGGESFANRLTQAARAYREDLTPLQRDVARVMRADELPRGPDGDPRGRCRSGCVPAASTLVETVRAAAVLVALVPQGLWSWSRSRTRWRSSAWPAARHSSSGPARSNR